MKEQQLKEREILEREREQREKRGREKDLRRRKMIEEAKETHGNSRKRRDKFDYRERD